MKDIKLSLDIFKKNKKDIYFSIIGSVLIIILIYVFVTNISFLVSSVESALSVESASYTIVHFNLGALNTLGITQSSSTASATSTP